ESDHPDGAAIYQVRCAFCHGDMGRGDGPAGRRMQPPPANFAAPEFWAGHTPEQVGQVILRGVPDTSMPGYEGTLTTCPLASVVKSLETLPSQGLSPSLRPGRRRSPRSPRRRPWPAPSGRSTLRTSPCPWRRVSSPPPVICSVSPRSDSHCSP